MRVYIAGPMSGYPEWNFPAFNRAEAEWVLAGWEVSNPAKNFGGKTDLPYETYLKTACLQVADADAVAVLEGWEASRGAVTEVHIAMTLSKPVYDARFPAFKVPLGNAYVAGVCGEWFEKENQRICEAERKAFAKRNDQAVASTIEKWRKAVNEKDEPRLLEAAVGQGSPVHDFAGRIDGGGYKGSMDDPKKLPIWLVPNALVFAAARSLQHGAKKYAPNNWRRGIAYSEVYSALQRHMLAWLEREDHDPDSGLSHLDHAAACLAFLTEYEARPEFHQFDDRLRRPE